MCERGQLGGCAGCGKKILEENIRKKEIMKTGIICYTS